MLWNCPGQVDFPAVVVTFFLTLGRASYMPTKTKTKKAKLENCLFKGPEIKLFSSPGGGWFLENLGS